MASGGPNTQTIHIPLDGGIDQRTSRAWTQSPAVLDAVNVRYRQVGGVEKRPGVEVVASQWSDGQELATTGAGKVYGLRDAVVVTDGERIGALAGGAIYPASKVPEATPTTQVLTTSMSGLGLHDVALASGRLFTAWTTSESIAESGRLNVQCTDPDSGALLAVQWFLASITVTHLRMATIAGDALLVYIEAASASIKYVRFSGTTGLATGSGSLVIDSVTTGLALFDAIEVSGSLYLVYSATGNALTARKFDSALTLTATVTPTETTGLLGAFSMSHSAGTLWISYRADDGTNHHIRAGAVLVPGMTVGVSPFDVQTAAKTNVVYLVTAITALSATKACAAFSGRSVAGGAYPYAMPFTSAPVVTLAVVSPGATARTNWWTQICGRPFVRDGKTYGWVYSGGTRFVVPDQPREQPWQFTAHLVDYGTDDASTDARLFRPICWVEPRTASFGPTDYRTYSLAAAGFRSAAAINNVGYGTVVRSVAAGAGRIALTLATADFDAPSQLLSCQLGRSLLLSPGWYWDGHSIGEIGFCYWPQSVGVTFATGGSLVSGVTYRWRVCYVYIDATGDAHRSEPSDYVEAAASDTRATVNVPSLCLTGRQQSLNAGPPGTGAGRLPEVFIEVYRTQDVTVDPNTYYLAREGTYLIANVPTSPYVAVADGVSDAVLATNRQLYTQGGVLPNVQPASFSAICTYRNRVWGASGHTVWYSKAYVTGDAVAFVDAFTLPLEEASAITSLWVQDDTLFISTDSAIYYIQGDGPNDLGNLNDIGTPNRVATDRGVADPRSVVTGPLGTYYRSRVGIQMLDRGRSVSPEPVGARVQDLLDDYPNITSALVHPTGAYVTFIASQGNDAIRLVHDYTADKWSRDVVRPPGSPLLRSAANVAGVQYTLAGGALYRETPNSYLDVSAWIPMVTEIAEQHPGGPQGNATFFKWVVLADRVTAHDLTASWFSDYATDPFESQTREAAALVAPVEQVSFNPRIHRAQTMRMRLTDAPPSSGTIDSGQGARWMALAIEIEPIDNKSFRLPAAQKG